MTYNDLEWLFRVKLGFRASYFTHSIGLSKPTTNNKAELELPQ